MISDSLCDNVQHNCNIADAKHAANYTLCTYLMKMREYFRWEMGYSYSKLLPKEEVGEWVAEREGLWEQLEEESFLPIEIDGDTFDPFDTDKINKALLRKGMVYSGGIGARSIPHFFLGKLDTTQNHEDFQVVISSEECARDLGAPPAMTLGNTIFIRKESIQRMLWEKIQEWQWHKQENAMAKAISYYDFDNNLEAALNKMTDVELQSIVLHEIGEVQATKVLGDQWKILLSSITDSRTELMLRAIKDLFADCLTTLPTLIKNNNVASIHFYAANMTAIRKDLCPSFMSCYQQWVESGDIEVIHQWAQKNATHWQKVLEEILSKDIQTDASAALTQYIESNRS